MFDVLLFCLTVPACDIGELAPGLNTDMDQLKEMSKNTNQRVEEIDSKLNELTNGK